MKKHISEVEIRKGYDCDDPADGYSKDDFCLLCGYFMEGDRLYLEIHGSNGALNRIKDIDSSQPYVCMECAGQFEVDRIVNKCLVNRRLMDFIKEGKK